MIDLERLSDNHSGEAERKACRGRRGGMRRAHSVIFSGGAVRAHDLSGESAGKRG